MEFLFCGSGFSAAMIEAESLSHKFQRNSDIGPPANHPYSAHFDRN
jgi:hypothetical protein